MFDREAHDGLGKAVKLFYLLLFAVFMAILVGLIGPLREDASDPAPPVAIQPR